MGRERGDTKRDLRYFSARQSGILLMFIIHVRCPCVGGGRIRQGRGETGWVGWYQMKRAWSIF